jgi:hypothetical protein
VTCALLHGAACCSAPTRSLLAHALSHAQEAEEEAAAAAAAADTARDVDVEELLDDPELEALHRCVGRPAHGPPKQQDWPFSAGNAGDTDSTPDRFPVWSIGRLPRLLHCAARYVRVQGPTRCNEAGGGASCCAGARRTWLLH